MSTATAKRLTEREVFALLERRLGSQGMGRGNGDAWALLPSVASGTGANARRTADAIAMSLWPSRGLEIHGFEIKSSRSDWLREMTDGAKAEEIARYCDRWWLVAASPDIVRLGELPEPWGLLVAKGGKLYAEKEPAKLDPQPLDRKFVAAMLRVAARKASATPEEVEAAKSEAYESARASFAAQLEASERRATQLQDRERDFLQRLGSNYYTKPDDPAFVDAFKAANQGNRDIEHLRSRLQRLVSDAKTLGEQAQRIEGEHFGAKPNGGLF